jgi:hypothetical protein
MAALIGTALVAPTASASITPDSTSPDGAITSGAPVAETLYDGAGNRYDMGDLSGTVVFGAGPGQTLTGPSGGTPFVASYTSGGALRWVHKIGSGYPASRGGLAVTASGTAVVNGSGIGTIRISTAFGDRTLASHGGIDTFLVAFGGNDGHIVFARNDGGTGADYGHDVAVDGFGNIYSVGTFGGSATFGDAPSSTTLVSGGYADGFVASFTPGGVRRFAVANSTGPNMTETRMITIGAGAVYVSGTWNGSNTIGGSSMYAAGSGNDLYVERINPTDGSAMWVRLVKRTVASNLNYAGAESLTIVSGTLRVRAPAFARVVFSVPGYLGNTTFTPTTIPSMYTASYASTGLLQSVAAS